MRVVLLGAPGSGKGTQAQKLVARYGMPQISTGDLLREAVSEGSVLGKKASMAMDAGELVADEIVLGMIRERLDRQDPAGFVLDGFPRNETQAGALEGLLETIGQPLDCAVLMDVDFEILMQRLTGRRSCPQCGRVYNVYFSPPQQTDVCDHCGGRLEQRTDDNEATIRNRLEVYESRTRPLIGFYARRDLLQIVDAEGDIDEVFERLISALEHLRKSGSA
ncbi:MAG: adenylate kinase [Gammaproteobacteria bacterium]|nr:adenylate kinase [Gammaproteobacteria bacterium]